MSLMDHSPSPFCVILGIAPFAFRVGPTSETLRRNDAAQRIARAVALRAVAGTVHQIGTAIPLSGLRRIRLERLAIKKQKFPTAHQTADVERKRQIVIAHVALHGWQRLEIGKQIAHIADAHALIRAIWKRREIMGPRRRCAFLHGGHKLRLNPCANTVFGIG